MNRIDRLSAILIQLQTKRLVKAQDLADRFAISLRTIYRDVKALEEAGVPIIGEAGEGYRLMEGYKLPPVMFNQNEASALLTASKLMQSITKGPLSTHYSSALDKIKAVLRWTEKDHMAEIDQHIEVVNHPSFASSNRTEIYLPQILNAIASSKNIHIQYRSLQKQETSIRKVEPIGVYYQGGHWYLVAFCHLRNDYRNFRTDKIERLDSLEEAMSKDHPPLKSFLNKITERKEVVKVVVDIDRNIIPYLGEQKYYNGFIKEEDRGDQVRMTFLCGSLIGFSHWFMWFGERATIVEPSELADHVITIAENILKKIGNTYALLT